MPPKTPGSGAEPPFTHRFCRRATIKDKWGTSAVAFTPDGRNVVTAKGIARSLDVWGVETGERRRLFEGHRTYVTCLAVSPDGGFVLSGGADGTIRLWRMDTGECVWLVAAHRGGVNALEISADGNHLLSGGEDGLVRLWRLVWDYRFPERTDWDGGAQPYLESFLVLHSSGGKKDSSRVGEAAWNEDDFKQLLRELGYRGYGWLNPEGVRRKLEEMAANWQGPPPLYGGSATSADLRAQVTLRSLQTPEKPGVGDTMVTPPKERGAQKKGSLQPEGKILRSNRVGARDTRKPFEEEQSEQDARQLHGDRAGKAKCWFCGKSNLANARVCEHCGVPLEDERIAPGAKERIRTQRRLRRKRLMAGFVSSAVAIGGGIAISMLFRWTWLIGMPLATYGLVIVVLTTLATMTVLDFVTCPKCGKRAWLWRHRTIRCVFCGAMDAPADWVWPDNIRSKLASITRQKRSVPNMPRQHTSAAEQTVEVSRPTRPTPHTVNAAVGRNNPCPCGSGKKYKECHGRQQPAKPPAGQETPMAGTDPRDSDDRPGSSEADTLLKPSKGQRPPPELGQAVVKTTQPSEKTTKTPPENTCPGCGKTLDSGVRLCPYCGMSLSEPRETPLGTRPPATREMVCSDCGSRNPPGNAFCNECGNPLVGGGEVKCDHCGKGTPGTARFCVHCGEAMRR